MSFKDKPSFGWVEETPEDLDRFEHSQAAFAATPAFAFGAGSDNDRFLWADVRKVFSGDLLPTHTQQGIGDCVSHALGTALDYLQCIALAAGKDITFNPVATEVIYGLARVQFGRQDRLPGEPPGGCQPLSAINALREVGALPRDDYPGANLLEYNDDLARRWSTSGVPQSLVARATTLGVKIRDARLATSYEDAAAAIRGGYPVVVASNVGFGDINRQPINTRDSDGFCQRGQQPWYHCMLFVGVRGQPRPGLCCLNSWGDDLFRGPTPDGMPQGAFWVDQRVAAGMLSQRNSFVISLFDNFPATRITFG